MPPDPAPAPPPVGPAAGEARARRAVLARAVAARPDADPRHLRALLTAVGFSVDARTLVADLDALDLQLVAAADGAVRVAAVPPPPVSGRALLATAALVLAALALVVLLGVGLLDGRTDLDPPRVDVSAPAPPSTPAPA